MLEYLVSYGKSGALGRFVAETPITHSRGAGVVIRTARGLELGVILRPAVAERKRLLEETSAGCLLRRQTLDDEKESYKLRECERQLFEHARSLACQQKAPVEFIDVEVLFDKENAVLQVIPWAECDLRPLVSDLETIFQLAITLEDLSLSEKISEETGGCGQPNCGREAGGSCNSCGEGGCSSCGDADLRNYFAHLRGKMEQREERVSLL